MSNKTIAIQDVNIFKSLYEIELLNEPNQTFTLYLGQDIFQIDLRTYVNDNTRITIKANNEIITNNSPVSVSLVNLNFFTNFKNGIFFFWQNPNVMIENPNYLNFGKDLKLYYGTI